VHTGSELVRRYWESNNEVLQSLFILSFSLSSLSFAVLFAGTYMSLVNKQKEMAVWYISGVAWKDCILIAITPKMLSILCGYWFALFYYVRQTGQEIDYGITAHFRWVYIPISLSIIGLIFLSGVYPFYSISVKKSPIELFRKD
ncbi:MAG: hypothetical protein PHP22_08870, partial [Oscillospiraceae bacterium]|nr:hypothetical protein [Oscillospiraceae bacterium]